MKRSVRSFVAIMASSAALLLVGFLGLPGVAQAGVRGSTASGWHIAYYENTAPVPSLGEAPSARPNGIAFLNFTAEDNTSLLVTKQKAQFTSLLGNLTGETITARFTVSGVTGAFTYYGEGTSGNPCGAPANARLYFQTSNAGGFDETNYWWSNPADAVLANGTFTVSATVNEGTWSDFSGHQGSTSKYSAGFSAAADNVTEIGLSFGGGCFFENGVGTTDGSGTLTLDWFTAQSAFAS